MASRDCHKSLALAALSTELNSRRMAGRVSSTQEMDCHLVCVSRGTSLPFHLHEFSYYICIPCRVARGSDHQGARSPVPLTPAGYDMWAMVSQLRKLLMVSTQNVWKYRSWTSAHAKARSGRHYHHGASEVRWLRVGESVIADHTFLCSRPPEG